MGKTQVSFFLKTEVIWIQSTTVYSIEQCYKNPWGPSVIEQCYKNLWGPSISSPFFYSKQP